MARGGFDGVIGACNSLRGTKTASTRDLSEKMEAVIQDHVAAIRSVAAAASGAQPRTVKVNTGRYLDWAKLMHPVFEVDVTK
jgi:ferric iron reductase protein FhuF